MQPSFGTTLRIMRAARNISQVELARSISLSQYDISRLENDLSAPTPATLAALSKILKFDFASPGNQAAITQIIQETTSEPAQ